MSAVASGGRRGNRWTAWAPRNTARDGQYGTGRAAEHGDWSGKWGGSAATLSTWSRSCATVARISPGRAIRVARCGRAPGHFGVPSPQLSVRHPGYPDSPLLSLDGRFLSDVAFQDVTGPDAGIRGPEAVVLAVVRRARLPAACAAVPPGLAAPAARPTCAGAEGGPRGHRGARADHRGLAGRRHPRRARRPGRQQARLLGAALAVADLPDLLAAPHHPVRTRTPARAWPRLPARRLDAGDRVRRQREPHRRGQAARAGARRRLRGGRAAARG